MRTTLKEYSQATDDEYCFIENSKTNKYIKQSEILVNNGYKNVIISHYGTIEEILKKNAFSSYQLITKKKNLKCSDYINLARIYEKGWNYIIIHCQERVEATDNKISLEDIITSLRINRFEKTIKLLMMNRNDSSLKTFDKAIFNLYSTIAISRKSLTAFELDFSVENSLFNSLKEHFKYTSNFKFENDYVYYDQYKVVENTKSKIIKSERYDKQYWFNHVNYISRFIKEYLTRIDEKYGVLEIVNDNVYYYHQFMLNAPDVIYVYYSVHDIFEENIEEQFQDGSQSTFKDNFLKRLSKTYPQKTFKIISNEFDGYCLSIYADVMLINSLSLVAGGVISTGLVYVYNTCPSIVKLPHWKCYDDIGEWSVCCIGMSTDFIEHYLKIGFTKIIFWNNGNELLKEYNPNVFEIPLKNEISNMLKFQYYNETIRRFCKTNDKLLVIDDDEFLGIDSVISIEDFNKMISFKWDIYGAGNEIFKASIERFTFVEHSNEFKTMVLVKNDITFESNHRPTVFEERFSKIPLKHYITKSLEEYIEKCRKRIDSLGSLRYSKQAYSNFIKINPKFSSIITQEEFNEMLYCEDFKEKFIKIMNGRKVL